MAALPRPTVNFNHEEHEEHEEKQELLVPMHFIRRVRRRNKPPQFFVVLVVLVVVKPLFPADIADPTAATE
jgi:hypothetical protein